MDSTHREKRLHVVSFRLTDTEAARVDAAGAIMTPRRTRQDWCRAAALHIAKAKIPAPPPLRRNRARNLPPIDAQLLSQVLGQLGKIGSNLNQLARSANATGRLPEQQTLAATANELRSAAQAVRAILEGGRGD